MPPTPSTNCIFGCGKLGLRLKIPAEASDCGEEYYVQVCATHWDAIFALARIAANSVHTEPTESTEEARVQARYSTAALIDFTCWWKERTFTLQDIVDALHRV